MGIGGSYQEIRWNLVKIKAEKSKLVNTVRRGIVSKVRWPLIKSSRSTVIKIVSIEFVKRRKPSI